jgi:DEAD/DEAH box helicase domain-containing protein
MFNEVIFDVETKKLFSDIEGNDPGDLGVSIVSLYQRRIDENYKEVEGKIISFWEDQFSDMWPIFQEADRIIGYNSIGFDVPALTPYSNFPFRKLPHFDIMLKVKGVFGKRISLDDIAKETLDTQKSDHGLNAVYYWEKADKESLEKLKKYCEDDVIITRDIYDFVLANGHLLFKDKWNTLRNVKLNFLYPKEDGSGKQAGLF